jgi:hypothetical protein
MADISSGRLDGLRKLFKEMAACPDPGLSRLFENAAEYARVYLLAIERQKGCDGMGIMMTMKEDFKSALRDLLQRCSAQGYIHNRAAFEIDFEIDINRIARELERMEKQ